MISHEQKLQVERKVLDLLAGSGLPKPDEIQYGEREVRFLWTDRKVAVCIDLDDLGVVA
jgi:hypothetical protein